MAGSLILERFRAAPRKALYPEVSLEAEEGSIVGILGRSGIGKTTLLRAILGTVPSAGKAFIGDEIKLDLLVQGGWLQRDKVYAIKDIR